MASSVPFALFRTAISLLLSLSFSSATSIHGVQPSTSPFHGHQATTASPMLATTSPPVPQPPSSPTHDLLEHTFFSQTALLPPVLSNLGFHELATAAPSLTDSFAASWNGPSTLFAPSDASLRTCVSCSVPNLLREHMVPGLFTIDYLRKLAFGTKIETLSPGRCVTVTRESFNNISITASKVFIGGVEITQPDLFNNGLVVVHGLQGFISPLSPFSCEVERMTSLSFPFNPDHRVQHPIQPPVQPAIMRLMLRDAMLRLRNNGFSILSLAMKIKYADLVNLTNMTVFALDDVSIFSGSQSYISNVRFHIVPNHFMTMADLEKLPVGTLLPTLNRGQSLVITTAAGGGVNMAPLRINYVRVRVPDVMRNLKIVVHSVFLPFPHIHPVASVYDDILGGGSGDAGNLQVPDRNLQGITCAPLEERGGCSESPMQPLVKPAVEVEDHHGL
ncbi:hypothetical protein FNV43_RR19307 [Rhamnella rubrinervis]|uniref:FAS1 domain-containing protein n=1 Tax=Rhamnella rubrinervis TaxID=2594499 RepID=A0A8K0E2E0_9ROSA|nr:hypothetical protein FNV43_RR19307 [Rhamnella rubrinervis]